MTETRIIDPETGGEKGSKLERMDLLPWDALGEVARHFGVGADKYEDRNWERGYAWSLSFAALQRHLAAWWQGEDLDDETGSSHLAAAAFHVLVMMSFQGRGIGTDDRPEIVPTPDEWRPAGVGDRVTRVVLKTASSEWDCESLAYPCVLANIEAYIDIDEDAYVEYMLVDRDGASVWYKIDTVDLFCDDMMLLPPVQTNIHTTPNVHRNDNIHNASEHSPSSKHSPTLTVTGAPPRTFNHVEIQIVDNLCQKVRSSLYDDNTDMSLNDDIRVLNVGDLVTDIADERGSLLGAPLSSKVARFEPDYVRLEDGSGWLYTRRFLVDSQWLQVEPERLIAAEVQQ